MEPDPGDKRQRVSAIVRHLWELGYRNILHVETQQQITPEKTAAQGACTFATHRLTTCFKIASLEALEC